MARSIKANLQRVRNDLCILALSFIFAVPAFSYTDQIAIDMPNGAKSIYDIRVHSFIRHLYEEQVVIDPTTPEWLNSFFEAERESYIEQYLAQNYVTENDLNSRPSKEEVDRGVSIVRKNFKTNEQRAAALKKLEVTDDDIGQWVTYHLTFKKFLKDVIQSRVVLTDQRVKEHYDTWKSTRFLDRPYAEIEKKVRDDLFVSLLKEEFQKWIDQEKRRKKLIVKSLSPETPKAHDTVPAS